MKLPPLNAVRAFEAAGRLENFSKAAAELKVTPGAVSRQVRKLEEFIGAELFMRIGTEVRLTDQGRIYRDAVEDALGRLEAGTQRIRGAQDNAPLHIWGSRFFIRLWLIPRLPDFHQRHPDQEVMITTALPTDPVPNEFDVAIRLGPEARPGYRSDVLIRRVLIPACSPSFLAANPDLKRPQDLEHVTLLQTPLGAREWDSWYEGTGAAPVPLRNRMTFTSSDLAYSAALDGLGMVLGRRGFFDLDIQRGNLVTVFDHWHHADDAFYLIYKDSTPQIPRIMRFRAWLNDQIQSQLVALNGGVRQDENLSSGER